MQEAKSKVVMGGTLTYCGISEKEADDIAAALVRAVWRASRAARAGGGNLVVWRNNQVIKLTSDEFEAELPRFIPYHRHSSVEPS